MLYVQTDDDVTLLFAVKWLTTARGGLAIGRTGRIPGGLAANLARYPTFYFYFYVVVFACRMYTKVIISEFAIQ